MEQHAYRNKHRIYRRFIRENFDISARQILHVISTNTINSTNTNSTNTNTIRIIT